MFNAQVCEQLGIVEVDYFGLKYYDNKKNEAVWVNLRNQLSDELPGPPPYRLRLCVKFFTQPENILQEPTR